MNRRQATVSNDVKAARQRLVDQKLWGRIPERAILKGHWDGGALIKDEFERISLERAALKEINPDD